MSKHRRAAKVDSNQPDIVKALRSIPGVTVKTGVDDIFVGRSGVNYWFEIKNPDTSVKKRGGLRSGALRDSQVDLEKKWAGHYAVCWTLEMVLKEIGIIA